MLRLFRSALRRSSPSPARRFTAARLVAIALATATAVRAHAAPEVPAAQQNSGTTSADFTFASQGLTLSGVITQPVHGETRALIVLVHGYGGTDVRGWNMYADLRERFGAVGVASVTWDKPGQGRSAGTFDVHQPVDSSAQEVLDAVAHLRTQHVPGAHRIGLWGISRAGWIAPIALSRDPDITFWISVSGVTAEDNFLYLLQSNLPHEGSTPEEARRLLQEWTRGFELFRTGASHEEYRRATRNVWANAFLARMLGEAFTRETYEREQAKLRSAAGPPPFDLETGMTIYVQDFAGMLASLDVDVLALFGERDLNVDWRKTRGCYERTIGRNPRASLTVRTFPDGNHNIDVSATGSMREMQRMTHRHKSDGYYETQIEWLQRHVLREQTH